MIEKPKQEGDLIFLNKNGKLLDKNGKLIQEITKNHIIMIDGDPYSIDEYYKEIQKMGRPVVYSKGIREALSYIYENEGKIELIIAESDFSFTLGRPRMGSMKSKESGEILYNTLKTSDLKGIPILILTNKTKEAVSGLVEKIELNGDGFAMKEKAA